MSAFVDTSRIAVTAEGEIDPKTVTPDMDVMFVRKKMDFGTANRVQGAAMKLAAKMGANEDPEAAIDVGAWNLALAQHNILDWSGPAFAGAPCNHKSIARLDPDFPVLKMAMKVIGERNSSGESADPK